MLDFTEYASWDGTRISELIGAGDVSAREVSETAIAAISAVDPTLSAVAEGPLVEASAYEPASAFRGVPFVLKDVACHAAGIPMYMGSRALAAGFTYDHDSILMSRFRRAGLALVATTKTPELALNASTEPLLYGPVYNPWNRDRTVGGSSGGSAALVAAGAVPIAHANDGGGSIRVPSCHTGLVGLKPSRGRIPLGPGQQEIMAGNAIEFALTRTVRDAARLLDAVHGYAPGERYGAPDPEDGAFVRALRRRRRLRVAVSTSPYSPTPVDPAVRSAVDATARNIASLGHDVEYADLPYDWDELMRAFTTIWCFGTAATVEMLSTVAGVPKTAEYFENTTLVSAAEGLELGSLDLAQAQATMNAVSRRIADFMADWDVVVTPTCNRVAPSTGELNAHNTEDDATAWGRRILTAYPVCPLYNVTGAPAINVPAGVCDTHQVPIGVQLGADLYREADLLQLAAELEDLDALGGRLPHHHVGNLTKGGAQ